MLISLLNLHYKIFIQIFAHRLSQVLGDYIILDQNGFIKGRYLGNSIQQFVNLFEQIPETTIPTLFYFKDADKAFNRVDWTFMKSVLAKMGVGNLFRICIYLIYDRLQE